MKYLSLKKLSGILRSRIQLENSPKFKSILLAILNSRILKISLFISTAVVLLIIFFLPDNNLEKMPPLIYDSTLFPINDYVQSIRVSPVQKPPNKIPPRPEIKITGDIGQPEILNDVAVTPNKIKPEQPNSPGIAAVTKDVSESDTPFLPRQILEVMPKRVDRSVEGYIKLSLKIGIDGKVESYLILANTTNCSECLQNVLTAVHKSRWQPANIGGKNIEYWVQKSYSFN